MNEETRPAASDRPVPERRGDYVWFDRVTTRWADNDAYRHVNNVIYYSFFDTAVNRMLMQAGLLDLEQSPVVAYVVETRCHFFRPVAFPDTVWTGLRVSLLGRSSTRYDIGVFREDDELAVAQGSFTQVTVERATGRPVALPEGRRRHLEGLFRTAPGMPAQRRPAQAPD